MTAKITPPLSAPALVAVADYFVAKATYHARFAAEAVADGDLDVARKAAARATAEVATFEQLISGVAPVDTPAPSEGRSKAER
jgi:hypothetical protein